MPEVRHPRALSDVTGTVPARVTVRGATFAVDGDTVTLPSEGHVDALAAAYGLSPADLRTTETCDVVKGDGDVCGRELPCPYHTED